MTSPARLSRIRLGWLALAVFVVVVIGAAVYGFVVAPNLYPPITLPTNAPVAQGATEAARLAAITTTRASILAALAGVGALITIAINYRNSTISNETFRIAERGQLTDRYAKAIELLGDTDSVAIRLGGIYALQQFALDTRRPEDQNTVVEVLSAFVRLNLHPAAAVPADAKAGQQSGATSNHRRPPARINRPAAIGPPGPVPPPVDVLAAISVLAQLPDRGLALRADFTGLSFERIDLTGARLLHGNLRGVNLRGSSLRRANLSGAILVGCDLRNADLFGVRLQDANLSRAALKDANLGDATGDGVILKYSNLISATLRGALMRQANLSDADLRGADLSGAVLIGANLKRANLRNAILVSADLSRADLDSARMSKSDLSEVDLSNAKLNGTTFTFATLDDADLSGASGLTSAQLTADQRTVARNLPAPTN